MSTLKLKQSLKKKIILNFLIVCSLLISEKALADPWYNDCCYVGDCNSSPNVEENDVLIHFKFYKHGKILTEDSYIKQLDVSYSTDGGDTYKLLMSASSECQISKTWAYLFLSNRENGSKIEMIYKPRNETKNVTKRWGYVSHRLEVQNDNRPNHNDENWIYVTCTPRSKKPTTHVKVKFLWHEFPSPALQQYISVFKVNVKKLKTKSLNFSNSSPEQALRTEAKDNTVKAYKKANAIVVKGALSENIQVYTSTGKLVKSMVGDCDVLQIPVPANQVYIVNFGQSRYKVAL